MPAKPHRSRALIGAVLLGLVSAFVAGAGPAQADLTTVSVDTMRTGWDSQEPHLTPTDVTAPDFGQLFATQLDGQIYSQPVVAKNTLLVLTENDRAYGLDPVSGVVRWSRSFGPAWSVAPIGCGDLVPSIGVTSTPVVDPATGTAYFTAKVDDPANPDHPHWEFHAIDITTGTELTGFPTTITGSPDNDPARTFSPRTQLQRTGLLLMNGVVYVGFGSHCDVKPFSGYVMGFDASTGKRTAMWASQTGGNSGAGIWHAGGGLVSDGPGQIILSTGNGVSPAKGPGSAVPNNLAESVVRLQVQADRTLKATDFFSPVNNTNLDTDDTDFGSGGPMAVPDGFGTTSHPHLLVQTGKDGRVFLLDRDHLGGTGQGPNGTDDVLQTGGPFRGVWGHPAFWGGNGGYVYMAPSGGPLSAFKLGVTADGNPLLSRTGTSTGSFGFGSGSPVVTSTGTASALVWLVYSSGSNGTGAQLQAYDALPSKGTMTLRYSAPIGTASKFAVPATDSGRVYVGTRTGKVYGFGRPTTTAVSGTPTDFGFVGVGSSATQQVTVTATTAVTVNAVSTAAPFSTGAVTLPATLAAGDSLTVPVTFAPTSAGAVSGALSFATSAGTFAYDVHGYASQDGLRSDPTSVEFGEVPVGGRVTLSVSVSNSGSTSTQITGSTAPASPFSSSSLPAAGTTLAPGASISVPITFAPTATRTNGSEVVISSSTGNVHIAVTGKGVSGAPKLTITPTAIDFGSVAVGSSVAKTFDLSNAGNLVVTLTKAAPPAAPFVVPSPVAEGQPIEPGDVIHQSVSFSPTAAGTFSGSYVITANDGKGPQTVSFTGTGVAAGKTGQIAGLGGKCLDIKSASSTEGTPVQLYTCNGTRAQTWTLPGDGTIRGVSRCLDVAGSSTTKAAKVQIGVCDGRASQIWAPKAGTSQALVNTASGMCLDIPGAKPIDRVQLQIYPCNWSAAQKWVIPT
ncbi:MAG TPA: choice-of-anchor D domain-containing protein [Friedmanniella sp.]